MTKTNVECESWPFLHKIWIDTLGLPGISKTYRDLMMANIWEDQWILEETNSIGGRAGRGLVTEPNWSVFKPNQIGPFTHEENRHRTAMISLSTFGFTEMVGQFGWQSVGN